MQHGVVVGFLCPDCQTPMENAEAEVNLATLRYGPGPEGYLITTPKADDYDALVIELVHHVEDELRRIVEAMADDEGATPGELAERVALGLPQHLRPGNPDFPLIEMLTGIIAGMVSGELYEDDEDDEDR